MTNPNNQENTNTLEAWATGKVAMSFYGLAIGIFLCKSGMLQKITGKFFSKDKKEAE